MRGKVDDGDLVTIEPCAADALSVGDIVLVRVRGTDYLHLVKAIDRGRFLIGNNRGGTCDLFASEASGLLQRGSAATQARDASVYCHQEPRRDGDRRVCPA